jgi:RNA recognition motif-containing protein
MQTPSIDPNTVYISNLSYKRDRNGIRSIFSEFGQIRNIKIIVEPKSNQSRGMAFVEMAKAEQAKKAIEKLDQMRVDGRTIKAKYATPLKSGSISKLPADKEPTKDLKRMEIILAKKERNLKRLKLKKFDFSK